MKIANNIISKLCTKMIVLALVCVCMCYMFSGFFSLAYAQSFQESITRAETLIAKENKTSEEIKELNNMITQAKSVPAHKRTTDTKHLLDNYDKYIKLDDAQTNYNTAIKNFEDYKSGKKEWKNSSVTATPEQDLTMEIRYRELLLERAKESTTSSSRSVNLANLINKQKELAQYEMDNKDILAAQAKINSGGYAGLGAAMNTSTESDDKKARKKEVLKHIKDLEAEIKINKENLDEHEIKILERRENQDKFITEKSNLDLISKNLQEKYCKDKSPDICDWRTKATTSEIASYRGLSDRLVAMKLEINACSSSCAPSCYMAENKECLFCDLFKVAFNASSSIAGISMAKLKAPVIGIISVAMAIWLAVTILAFVSAPEVRDAKDLITAILNQSFIFAIVFILLQTGGSSFYNLALEPIFNTGMTIAEKTVASTKDGAGCEGAGGYGIISPAEGGGLPQSMGNSIICTMTAVQDRVARVRALGSAAICQSWEEKLFIIPHLGYFLTGLGLWIGGSILLLALPFLMLDSVLQLAVAAALLPAAIGCYTFKLTRGYVKKIWETFLNCMFVFIFLTIVILILATAFEQIVVDATNGNSLDNIIEAGTDVNMKVILKDLPWFSVAFLKVVFVLILTWTVMGEMLGFASQFSGSISSTKIGSSIGTMAASAAKGTAKTVLGKPAKAIANEAWDQTKRAGRGAVHMVRRATLDRQSNKVMRKAKEQGGVNADGSFTAKRKTWRGREVESTVSINADGTKTLKSIKQINENKRIVVQKDAYFTVKSKESNLGKDGKMQRDEMGNPVYKQTSQRVRINNDAVNKLTNADGTYNAEKMQEIIDNSSLPKSTVKALIASEIISKRMPYINFNARNHSMGKQTVTENADGSFVVSSQNAKGQKQDIRIAFGNNNRIMSEITTTDAKGRGRKLSSDGIINQRQTFVLDENGNIDEDSVESRYGYTSYYQSYYNQKRHNKIPRDESMYDREEVAQAATYAERIRLNKKQAMSEFGD